MSQVLAPRMATRRGGVEQDELTGRRGVIAMAGVGTRACRSARLGGMPVLRSISVLGLVSSLLACAQAQSPAPATPPPPTNAAASSSAPVAADPRFDAELSGYAYPFAVHFLEIPSQQQTVKMAYMDVPPNTEANGRTLRRSSMF